MFNRFINKARTILKKWRFFYFFYVCYIRRKDIDFINYVEGKFYNQFTFRSNGIKNKNIVVYDIHINGALSGLFAIYRFVLDACYIADRFKYKPYIVVNHSEYNDDVEKEDNIFESFFEQPSDLTCLDVNESYTVVDFRIEHLKIPELIFNPEGSLLAGYNVSEEYISEMARIRRKYLIYKSQLLNEINSDMHYLIGNKRVLGIHFRGNAYKIGFDGHPIALCPSDYFVYIDECLANGFNKIFLASDDENALREFTLRYGGLISFYSDTERSDDGIDVHNKKNNKYKRGYNIGFQVIRDVLTLSCCDGLICGVSQVSIGARIEKLAKKETFDYLKIINKGLYDGDNSKNITKYMKCLNK